MILTEEMFKYQEAKRIFNTQPTTKGSKLPFRDCKYIFKQILHNTEISVS